MLYWGDIMDCIFCGIVKKQIPSFMVLESNNFVAFLDIKPINPGHIVVTTKQHFESILDMPETLGQELVSILKKISKALVKALKADGFNIGLNNGAVAGQEIMHCHWHVIPRFKNDGLKSWPQARISEEELKQVYEKIMRSL